MIKAQRIVIQIVASPKKAHLSSTMNFLIRFFFFSPEVCACKADKVTEMNSIVT